MNFEALVQILTETHQSCQQQAVQAVNVSLVVRNWLFGFYIVEFEQQGNDRAQYGTRLLSQLADRLKVQGIKNCSVSNLRNFRQFYQTYSAIHQTLSGELTHNLLLTQLNQTFRLSWSHYQILMSLQNHDERSFYEIEAIANTWSVRELNRQITAALYERLALSRDKNEIKRLATQGQIITAPRDGIKDPYILEFLELPQQLTYSENELETAIINKLEQFLLELDKLTHQDLGQMQMYVNYFDRYIKTPDENPTIGIVLCKRKKDALVELTLPKDANIFASQYQLYLPSKEEFQQQLLIINEEFIK